MPLSGIGHECRRHSQAAKCEVIVARTLSYPPFEDLAAQTYVKRGIGLERVSEFVQKGLGAVERRPSKRCARQDGGDRRLGDVVPLTSNVDESVAEIEPYMVGIPRNWIFDTEGVFRWEQVGYNNSDASEEAGCGKAVRLIDTN